MRGGRETGLENGGGRERERIETEVESPRGAGAHRAAERQSRESRVTPRPRGCEILRLAGLETGEDTEMA